MIVDSASWLQRPYGTSEKTASAILAVVKRFVADVGVSRAFRTDNGAGYTRRFVGGKPWNITRVHGPVHPRDMMVLSRALKAGFVARLGVPHLYPSVRLEKIRACTDAAGINVWLEKYLLQLGGYLGQRRAALPPRDTYSTGAARRCHCSLPARILVCLTSGRRAPGLAYALS